MPGKDIVRLQFEIDKEQLMELDNLRELGGLRTKKELWDNAFTLLKWAARVRAGGAAIFSVKEDEDSYKELQMPFLETYASSVQRQSEEDEPDRVAVISGGDRGQITANGKSRGGSVAVGTDNGSRAGSRLSLTKRKIRA